MTVFGRFSYGLSLVALAACAVCAHGATLTPDFNTFGATRTAQVRTGDFDGDGRRDELYLVNEADSGRVAVHVRLNRAEGMQDLRVTSLDGDSAASLDIHVVAPGQYTLDCGDFSNACAARSVEARSDSLIMGTSGGVSVLMHWQDDHFEQDFVRSDEATMARALSALYAVNR